MPVVVVLHICLLASIFLSNHNPGLDDKGESEKVWKGSSQDQNHGSATCYTVCL